MTHEFIKIIEEYLKAKQKGLETVIATVVALDGSSYRKPGVRMLIKQNGQITGAVSGGCVENEIIKQSHSVFKTKKAKVITYDGRFRLGCEGILYILIEVFAPKDKMIKVLLSQVEKKNVFAIDSYFSIKHEGEMGSVIRFKNGSKFNFYKSIDNNHQTTSNTTSFSQTLKPIFRLIIIGAEHDSETLSKTAKDLGWEVTVVVSPSNPKERKNFPGSDILLKINVENIEQLEMDENTCVVLMTHNYARDLQFLIAINDSASKPIYCGLLGSSQRRERLLNELVERIPDIDNAFFDIIYGPTGLNIGAITPQEISLSICAEILSVTRAKQPIIKENLANLALSLRENG